MHFATITAYQTVLSMWCEVAGSQQPYAVTLSVPRCMCACYLRMG